MKLYLKDLTWTDTMDITSVYKTNFINKIDEKPYINIEIGLIKQMRNKGNISENKSYEGGGFHIRRCINIKNKWYGFTTDSEEEYLEAFYYANDIGYAQYLDRK